MTNNVNEMQKSNVRKTNKYHRQVEDTILDVYDVLSAFKVTNPATAHAVKKLLCPGQRGHKDRLTDLEEARSALERAIELEVFYDYYS